MNPLNVLFGMHLILFWPITTHKTILFHLDLWYCLYCKLSSHIPMALNFILLHCWFFFFFPLYPEACFSAAIEDLVSSESQGLLLECCIWNSSDISAQVHLLWTHSAYFPSYSLLLKIFIFMHFLCYYIALPMFISCISTEL